MKFSFWNSLRIWDWMWQQIINGCDLRISSFNYRWTGDIRWVLRRPEAHRYSWLPSECCEHFKYLPR